MLETPPELRIYSWNDVVRLTQQLADLVGTARSKPSVIIAILRGGAFPGLVLSHALGIRELYAIRVSTTLDETARGVRSVPLVEGVEALPNLRAEHVLMVDDVTNTGDTLTSAVRMVQKLPISGINTHGNYRLGYSPSHRIDPAHLLRCRPMGRPDTCLGCLSLGVARRYGSIIDR